jgi:amidase
MTSAELTGATAHDLARLIAEREVSTHEVVEAHLRRIDAVNGAINAVVQIDGDRAVARAREADVALARGERWGPLHGVPFTVKDNIAAAGIEMAIGVRERAGIVAREDATAVARLKAAGAILLGKTNCPPWGGGIETDNDLYGRTSNPYDLTRTPGGSSGGEAAIIAAKGSPCGLGTDSGASVRLPAHFCGLASIKPSAGRVPLTGVLDDEGQVGTLGDPRTQVGVLARSVADVALLVRLISGPDRHDGGVAPVPIDDPAGVDLRNRVWPSRPTTSTASRRRTPSPPSSRQARSCAPRAPPSKRVAIPPAGTSSRSRSGDPTAATSVPMSCGGCCADGTLSVARCSRLPSATASCCAPCSRARHARTAR